MRGHCAICEADAWASVAWRRKYYTVFDGENDRIGVAVASPMHVGDVPGRAALGQTVKSGGRDHERLRHVRIAERAQALVEPGID